MLWFGAAVYLAGVAAFGISNPGKLLFAMTWPIALPARFLMLVTMLIVVGVDSMS